MQVVSEVIITENPEAKYLMDTEQNLAQNNMPVYNYGPPIEQQTQGYGQPPQGYAMPPQGYALPPQGYPPVQQPVEGQENTVNAGYYGPPGGSAPQ